MRNARILDFRPWCLKIALPSPTAFSQLAPFNILTISPPSPFSSLYPSIARSSIPDTHTARPLPLLETV